MWPTIKLPLVSQLTKKIMLPDRLKDNDVKIELTQQQARDLLDFIFYKFHFKKSVIDEPVKTRLLETSEYLKKKLF